MAILLLLGTGIGLAFLIVALGRNSDRARAAPQPQQVGVASLRAPSAGELGRSDTEQDIDPLLADGSPRAWGRVAALYSGSSERTKRRVLEGIHGVKELERAIAYVLATVGEDPTPPDVDPMIDEAAAALGDRWKTNADVEYGRRAMVMQKTDKRRWVLARALLVHFERAGDESTFVPLKAEFEAKLIDLHAEVINPFVKGALIDGVRSLGGKDAALILTKGLAVRDDELEVLNEQRAAVESAMEPQSAP